MRAEPAGSHRADVPGREVRIHFPAPLVGVRLVPADTPLPPIRRPPSPPAVEHRPPPPPVSPPPPPLPTNPWDTELGRELRADRERIEAVLGELRAAAHEIRAQHAERLPEWQRAAVELALTIATKLLHQQVTAGEFAVEAMVREMVGHLGEEPPAAIRLNPADLELLEKRLGGQPLLPGRDDPRLIPDPALGRGACQVEGKESMLLSEVSGQLQEIRDQLLRSLGHARP